jgi:hypothetical protein
MPAILWRFAVSHCALLILFKSFILMTILVSVFRLPESNQIARGSTKK